VAEVTTGVRSVLSSAGVYSLLQRLLGAQRSRRRLVDEFLRPGPGDRILDIGCGTAEILDALPDDVEYVGLDHSPRYVEAARARYGTRGRFLVGDAADMPAEVRSGFSLVVVMGVLHHLGDDEVVRLMRAAAKALTDDGRFVSSDNVWTEQQPWIARQLIARDRGANVRTVDTYVALAEQVFSKVVPTVRDDFLRVPYTLVMLECAQPRRA
jgi:SAM-dependent methyltransferase